jgi:hypothetical protein
MAGYYHHIQNSYFGTASGPAPCSGPEHAQCGGTFDVISAVVDWRFAPEGETSENPLFYRAFRNHA